MRLLLALACTVGSFGLITTLGLTSASCGDKEGDSYLDPTPQPPDPDEDTDIDTTPLDCEKVDRKDCPTGSEPTVAERNPIFSEAREEYPFHATTWGWDTGLLDFRCCRVTTTTVHGIAKDGFTLGWDSYDAEGNPVEGGQQQVRAGDFEVEIDFLPEDVVQGLFLSAEGTSKGAVERFGDIHVSFAVESL